MRAEGKHLGFNRSHDVEDVAELAPALVHLAEIAFRTRGRLDFDPKTERFTDSDEANQLLSKKYRVPFGLPDVG